MRPLISFFERGDMERLTIFTANIGRKSGIGERAANLRRVKNGTKDLANVVVGWQEIDDDDTGNEHGMIKDLWPHQQMGAFSTAIPVLASRPVEMGRVQITQTCHGRPKVTPARFCVQAIYQLGDIKMVHMNGHYPFNAQDLRTDCHREWTRLAHDWVEKGWFVVTTRDTNWHGKMPKLHPKERLLTAAGAIDRITIIPSNKVNGRVTKRHKINLTIDGHDAIGLTLALRG